MLPEVPQLSDFHSFAWHCSLQNDHHDLLTLSKIEGVIPPLPDLYVPPAYAIEFITRGRTRGMVNTKYIELHPNDAFFILADSIHKEATVSPDCEIYIMGFTTQFAEMLNLSIPQAQLSQLLIHPVWHLTDDQMTIVLKYFELLRMLIEAGKSSEVLHLVRSLLYNLSEDYARQAAPYTLQATLTRPEQICGQFLSLIELHCRTHHQVAWYAEQLHLSPKYLSNMVHQTLHTSPNACIDQALTRQAQSLLSYTSLSIQQIADKLGFLNQSHFGAFFKRHTGYNPSAFKTAVK